MLCAIPAGHARFLMHLSVTGQSPPPSNLLNRTLPVEGGLDVPEEVEGQLLGLILAGHLALTVPLLLGSAQGVSKGYLQGHHQIHLLVCAALALSSCALCHCVRSGYEVQIARPVLATQPTQLGKLKLHLELVRIVLVCEIKL